eukprot:gene29283-36447_t
MKLVGIPKDLRAARKERDDVIVVRAPGQGRKLKADEHPAFTAILKALFDCSVDGSGGLESHPRLITEVLFRQSSGWMNMPRAVAIINDHFQIPVSISCAYTYSENFRAGTAQAKRHHAGRGINPGISLQRSTRDGNSHESRNAHFATAGMNYSYNDYLDDEYGAVLAGDAKAKTHTDVAPVQRPGKSWSKVVFDDHDWDKRSKRDLVITTYQLVVPQPMLEKVPVIHIDGRPLISTRVTGAAISVVKINYFEDESTVRNMQERFLVMAQDRSKPHFSSPN